MEEELFNEKEIDLKNLFFEIVSVEDINLWWKNLVNSFIIVKIDN